MSDNPALTGILMLCLCTIVPMLIGLGIGYRLRGRLDRLGLPWGLLPAGAYIKRIWEDATNDN